MITLFQAIQSLVPGAEVSVGIFDQSIEWHNPTVPPVTLEQIHQEQIRLQKLYDWSEYQRNRASEYPSIQEQLDALYHAGAFPPEMANRIRAVKEKYPKPPISQQQWEEQMPVINTVETTVSPAVTPVAQPVNYPEPRMTVEEWFAFESRMTREEWLKRQSQPRQMTREEWLAEQANLRN
jgi:hypothetical protein